MNTLDNPKSLAFTPSEYEICIKGRLGPQTAAWFEDLIIGKEKILSSLIGEIIIFTHAKDLKEYKIDKIID